MTIYLVQHGLALPKKEDPQQHLSEEGRKQVQLIGGVAQTYGVQVATIYHSGKPRAEQTAEILSDILAPASGVVRGEGLGPLDDVYALATALPSLDRCMFVGHLPFMEKLTSVLTTGSVDHIPLKFQNGGIVCLDWYEERQSWSIRWTLMPNIG